jgi:hypothetical protein
MMNPETQAWPEHKHDAADRIPTQVRARWWKTVKEIKRVGEAENWSMAEVARRADVPSGTLNSWYHGSYTGRIDNVTDKAVRFLTGYEQGKVMAAQVPAAPEWLPTPTAMKVQTALLMAQQTPCMSIICAAPGTGKTMTARQFAATRPHCHLFTARPATRSYQRMLVGVGKMLSIDASPVHLDRMIGERLQRNGHQTLLMIDEAQELDDNAINQARHWLDEYGCGIALLGNMEIYRRIGGERPVPGFAQLHRRVGITVQEARPTKMDIRMLLDAWQVEDADMRKLLMQIGLKPGALGQLTFTLQLASQLAAADSRAMEANDIRLAWQNRGREDLP